MKYSLFVAAAFALICSSVSAGVKFSVESRLLDERLSSELQKAVKPVYVHTDDSVINLRGWVTPQLTLAPLRFQESSSSAIADLSFSGQVAFSSLRLKCLLQDRTVGGRIGFSGTARVMVTGERIALCCFSVNPQVQCLASDSPFLRFLFKRNAIREAIQKAIQKQAAIAAQSFVRTANKEFTTLAGSLMAQLQEQIPALKNESVQMKVQSGSGFASLLILHNNTKEEVEVRIGAQDFTGVANEHRIVARIWDDHESRFSTIEVTEKCLNRLYRIVIGKRSGETYTSTEILPLKSTTLKLSDNQPFLFDGNSDSAVLKMSFETIGDTKDGWIQFLLYPYGKDHELKIELAASIDPTDLPSFLADIMDGNGGKIAGFSDLSAKARFVLRRQRDISKELQESLKKLVQSRSKLIKESFDQKTKTISLQFQWTQIKQQPAK